VNEGLAVQFLERESEISSTVEGGLGKVGDNCKAWREWWDSGEYVEDGSGL
jgi:hypothetical protein